MQVLVLPAMLSRVFKSIARVCTHPHTRAHTHTHAHNGRAWRRREEGREELCLAEGPVTEGEGGGLPRGWRRTQAQPAGHDPKGHVFSLAEERQWEF